MAIRNLVDLFTSLLNGDTVSIQPNKTFGVRANRPAAEALFLDRGVVLAVTRNTVTVAVRGRTDVANLVTDEPLQAGQDVWVSQADDGTFVVHGSVK